MTWAKHYWDMVHRLYWAPECLGLKPFGKKISAPAHPILVEVNDIIMNSRVRARTRTWPQTHNKLMGDEETINAFFALFFSIVPDYLIERWLGKPLEIKDSSEFKSYSRLQISERYGWEGQNVTQHDGVFTSNNSIIGVELKLKARIDCNQFLKYAAIIALEENQTGRRKDVGLLYIVPENRLKDIRSTLASWDGPVRRSMLQDHRSLKLNRYVANIIESDRPHFEDVMSRMRLGAISWTTLYDGVADEKRSLDPSDHAHQALYRLLDGFAEQLIQHRDTGISPRP